MSTERRILIIGDNETAPYHPLNQILPVIEDILEAESLEYEVKEGTAVLEKSLKAYDLLIALTDVWEGKLSDEKAIGLRDYVLEGGKVLFIHNGICLAKHSEVLSVSGGEFTHHPEMADLKVSLDQEHPIGKCVEAFTVFEEPYFYEFLEGMEDSEDMVFFMKYTYDDDEYPSGWSLKAGKGMTVNLHPGHNRQVFENPTYQKVIKQAVLYLMNA